MDPVIQTPVPTRILQESLENPGEIVQQPQVLNNVPVREGERYQFPQESPMDR